MAACAYLAVEKPVRAWQRTPLVCAWAAALLLAGLFGLKMHAERMDQATEERTNGFERLVVRSRLYSCSQKRELSDAGKKKFRLTSFVLPESTPSLDTGIKFGNPSDGVDVLLLGDSHGMMFAPVIDDVLRDLGLRGRCFCVDALYLNLMRTNAVVNDQFGSAEALMRYDEAQRNAIVRDMPEVVIWVQRWDAARYEEVEKSLRFVLQRTQCLFVEQVPVLSIGDRCTLEVFGFYKNQRTTDLGSLDVHEPRDIRDRKARFRHRLEIDFGSNPRFRLFETRPELTYGENGIRWWDGTRTLFYLDDDHLTEAGSRVFFGRLRHVIGEMAGTPR